MLKKEAKKITGGLSKPSKMPGPAHNLPAQACLTGAKLVKIPGSVCAGCYALKGRYRIRNVRQALDRRLQALEHPLWGEAMVTLIKGQSWFRWRLDTQAAPPPLEHRDSGGLGFRPQAASLTGDKL